MQTIDSGSATVQPINDSSQELAALNKGSKANQIQPIDGEQNPSNPAQGEMTVDEQIAKLHVQIETMQQVNPVFQFAAKKKDLDGLS